MNDTITNCEFWPNQPDRCDNVYILFKLFSSVSLIGCLFIISIIILFKSYIYFSQRLILFLSLSAFVKVLANLFSVNGSHDLCVAQGFVIQFFGWAELLWVCSISVSLMFIIHGYESQKYEKWFHIATWCSALVISLFPFIGSHYGPAGMWCWIDREATGLRFGTWYIPLLVIIVLLVAGYAFVFVRAYCSHDIDQGFRFETMQGRTLSQEEAKPLLIYPMLYLILTIPILIYRIDDAAHPNDPPRYILLAISVSTSPLVGGVNALAFAFYQHTLKMLTWNKIKGAFSAWKGNSPVQVTHNYQVADSEADSQGLLQESQIQTWHKYGEESVA